MAKKKPALLCANCSEPLRIRDLDRGFCRDCRSPEGKVADLDIAIRASGDDPARIPEWPNLRHLLRKRFRDGVTSEELWERCTDWLGKEGGLAQEDFLPWPLSYLEWLLEHGFEKADVLRKRWFPALRALKTELERWILARSQSPKGSANGVEFRADLNRLKSAVAAVQSCSNGVLPQPAQGCWRRFLRDSLASGKAEAEQILGWIREELSRESETDVTLVVDGVKVDAKTGLARVFNGPLSGVEVSHAMDPAATETRGGGPFRRPRGKKRGRKKADYHTRQKETEIAESWRTAREAGVPKVDFAKGIGMSQADLDRLLDRTAKRKKAPE